MFNALQRICLTLSLALLLLAATADAQYNLTRLPSGKQVKVLAVGPLFLAGGKEKALLLKYETDKNIDDAQALAYEADDIWDLFRFDVESAGFNAAVVSANSKSSGGFIHTTKSYNFVFKKDAQGQWRPMNQEVTIRRPSKIAYWQTVPLVKSGQYAEALKLMDKSIDLDPSYAQAYADRGSILALLNKHDKALTDLNKALSLNPDNANAYMNRGSVYGALKQYQKAVQDFSKAIAISKAPVTTAAAYGNRGEAYVKMGQYQKALDDLNRAIASHPKPAESYHYRAIAYEKLGKKDLAKKDSAKAKQLGFQESKQTVLIEGH